MELERMDTFFAARVDGYDDHMIEEVAGCKEGYRVMASLVPRNARTLLDLGCGTGLELEAIFRNHPDMTVTGIDLTQAMLDVLAQKYPDKDMKLICGDYFAVDFGREIFDVAVSFQTLHHFSHERKTELYRKVHHALKPGGCYIECDYTAPDQDYEDFYFAENERLRAEQGIEPEAFFHYDTPCTVENQKKMLLAAGFRTAGLVWRESATAMIVAGK